MHVFLISAKFWGGDLVWKGRAERNGVLFTPPSFPSPELLLTEELILVSGHIIQRSLSREMANIRKIGWTLAQMLVGCCSGILAGGVLLALVNFAWRGLLRVNLGGFVTAVLLLISFLIVFGSAVMATAEGVRLMGRFIPRPASRRRMYEGSFLGACAAVAILTVTRADWLSTLEEWGSPIRLAGTLIYYVIALPMKFALFWLPPLVLLAIAAPIGAAIAYSLPPHEEGRPESKASGDAPDKGDRGEGTA